MAHATADCCGVDSIGCQFASQIIIRLCISVCTAGLVLPTTSLFNAFLGVVLRRPVLSTNSFGKWNTLQCRRWSMFNADLIVSFFVRRRSSFSVKGWLIVGIVFLILLILPHWFVLKDHLMLLILDYLVKLLTRYLLCSFALCFFLLCVLCLCLYGPVSYTHLTLPTIYSV